MRKLKIYTVVSFDGFISDREDDFDWMMELVNIPKTTYGIKRFMESVDSVIMSEAYYHTLFAYEMSYAFRNKQCYIISPRKPKILDIPNFEHIQSPPGCYSAAASAIAKLKEAPGGDICLAGGSNLIHAMIERNLVDEIIITMLPVALGRGVKLLPESFDETQWQKLKIKKEDAGAIQFIYQATRPGSNHWLV